MTDKEFEALKIGDKVWTTRYKDFKTRTSEAVCRIVRDIKRKPYGEILVDCYEPGCTCGGIWVRPQAQFLTKAEAWDRECQEEKILLVRLEGQWHEHQEALKRAELERSKAVEEGDGKKWYAMYKTDKVVYNPGLFYDKDYSRHDTEREAWEAIAERHIQKYEEALVNSGSDVRYYVSVARRVVMLRDCEVTKTGGVRGFNYDGNLYYASPGKAFKTRLEAEDELKRITQQ